MIEQIQQTEVFQVSYMLPEIVSYYWPEIERRLDEDPELWNKVYTKQNMFEKIHNGEIQVWVVFNGRIIRLMFFTQRYVAPNGIAALQIFWMYGVGVDDILYLLDDVVDRFAATADCQRLEITGRPGWGRKLKPLGAEYQFSVFSRPVRTVKEN